MLNQYSYGSGYRPGPRWQKHGQSFRPATDDGPPKVRDAHRPTKFVVYFATILFFAGCFGFFIYLTDQSEKQTYAQNLALAPRWNEQEMLANGRKLLAGFQTPEKTPAEHFEHLRLSDRYFWAYKLAEHENRVTLAMADLEKNIAPAKNNWLTTNSGLAVDREEWDHQLTKYNAEQSPQELSSDRSSNHYFLTLGKTLVLGMMPLALCCFLIWTYQHGGSPLAELAYFRIWTHAIAWPIGFFKFISGFNPKNQFERAYGCITMVIGAALTLGGACMASAQSRTGNQGNKQTYALIDQKTKPKAKTEKPQRQSRFVLHSTTELFNRYVGMNAAVFANRPPLQETITVADTKTGFYIQPFISAALTNRGKPSSNFNNELDFKLGWTRNYPVSGITIDLAVNYTDVTPLVRLPNGDVIQIYAKIGKTYGITGHKNQSVTPFFAVANFHPLKGFAPQRGTLSQFGTSYALQHNRFHLGAMAQAEHDTGAFGFSKAWLLRSSLDPGFTIRGNLMWYPAVFQFTAPLTAVRDSRRPTLVFGTRLAF